MSGRLDFDNHFDWLSSNLSIVLGPDPTYRELVAYLNGVDTVGNILVGFHAWMIAKAGGGNSLHWSRLAMFVALDEEPVHYSSDLTDDFHQRAAGSNDLFMSTLIDCVREFLSDVETLGHRERFAAQQAPVADGA